LSETKTKQVEMKANKNSKKKTSDGIAKSSKPKAEKPQPKIIEEIDPLKAIDAN
jgi:hypothetical protein